jgi:hypothetical protein
VVNETNELIVEQGELAASAVKMIGKGALRVVPEIK